MSPYARPGIKFPEVKSPRSFYVGVINASGPEGHTSTLRVWSTAGRIAFVPVRQLPALRRCGPVWSPRFDWVVALRWPNQIEDVLRNGTKPLKLGSGVTGDNCGASHLPDIHLRVGSWKVLRQFVTRVLLGRGCLRMKAFPVDLIRRRIASCGEPATHPDSTRPWPNRRRRLRWGLAPAVVSRRRDPSQPVWSHGQRGSGRWRGEEARLNGVGRARRMTPPRRIL